MGGGAEGGGSSRGGQRGGGRPSSGGSKSKKKSTKKSKSDSTKKTTDKPINFNGKWKGMAQTPRGEMEQAYEFKIEGNSLTGTMTTSRGAIDLENGQVDGNEFSFEISFGQFTMTQYGEVVDENTIVLSNDRGEVTLKKAL